MGLTMKQKIWWNLKPSFNFPTQSTLQIYQINEYKSIVLVKILTLIKKMTMIDLKDFGLPESPRKRDEQFCVNYGYEKR